MSEAPDERLLAAVKYDCFISYASSDLAFAEAVVRQLERHGLRVWFDRDRLVPGCKWEAVIENALAASAVVVPLLTVDWGKSHWTAKETYSGLHRVPIRASTLDEDQLPDTWRGVQYFPVDPNDVAAADWPAFCAAVRSAASGAADGDVCPENLPELSLGELFVGRDNALRGLASALLESNRESQNRVLACHAVQGLGGMGKTRLAVEFAWRHQDRFSALLFCQATSAETLRSSLAGLTGLLVADLAQKLTEEMRIDAVLRWLHGHPGWLLIIDNVDDEETARAVEDLLRRLRRGSVVITTRLKGWSKAVQTLDLGPLDEGVATQFLLSNTDATRRKTGQDESSAAALVTELDGLTLALQQAAAYISRTGISMADYLRAFRENALRVLESFDAGRDRYPCSLAVTWLTTFAQLRDRPRALLRCLAWFDPAPIPGALVERAPEWREATADLVRYNLLARGPRGVTWRMHRLVQRVTRDRLLRGLDAEGDAEGRAGSHSMAEESLLGAIQLLDQVSPERVDEAETWKLWAELYPHIAAVAEHGVDLGMAHVVAPLMSRLGRYLTMTASFQEAEHWLQRALDADRRALGEQHLTVAHDLVALATVLRRTDRLRDAEANVRRAVAILEAAGEADPVGMARALMELGEVLFALGQRHGRRAVYGRALDLLRPCGSGRPRLVAQCLNNLASAVQDEGDYGCAERLYREAIAMGERDLAADDPEPGVWYNNLATLYVATKQKRKARACYRTAAARFAAGAFPNHPDHAITLIGLSNALFSLPAWILGTRAVSEAHRVAQAALSIQSRVWGSEHRHTLRARLNLLSLLSASLVGTFLRGVVVAQMAAVAACAFLRCPASIQAWGWLVGGLSFAAVSVSKRRHGWAAALRRYELFLIVVWMEGAERAHEQGNDTRAQRLLNAAAALARQKLPPEHSICVELGSIWAKSRQGVRAQAATTKR